VRRPSLVLLDLALEAGSGLGLLECVRSSDGLASRIDPDLPVIVLTDRVAEADRVRSFARGADDHVCKPSRSKIDQPSVSEEGHGSPRGPTLAHRSLLCADPLCGRERRVN
jgi:CheY-like chemotaxis protein